MQNRFLFNFCVLTLLFLSIFLAADLVKLVEADTAATSVTVTGAAPTITGGPSDGGVTSTNPVNVGSNVTFTGTGTDSNGDDYYLAICKTDAISANNNATPTCTGGGWCYSAPASTTVEASCATTTLAAWSEQSAWYAFVCDKTSGSQCSASSQGTGNNGSPFHVNHAPSFSAILVDGNNAKNPGATVTLFTTSTDTDTAHSDTVSLVVCKTQGVTATACNGGDGDTWCTSTAVASDPSCSFAIPTPTAHGTTSTWPYIFDSHNFASDGASHNAEKTIAINDVAPTVASVTLNGGATIDVSTGGEGPSGAINVDITGAVTDNNGCADVATVTSSAYTSDIGVAGCTVSDSTCYYNQSCTGGSCTSGITKTYTCTVSFKYHSYPTVTGPKAASAWKSTVYATDGAAQGSVEITGDGVELSNYLSLDVTNAIAYGSLAIGAIADGTALPQTAFVSSTGNVGLDANFSGTNMASGGNTIAVGQQKYATTAVAYSAGKALTTSAVLEALRVKKPTSSSYVTVTSTYWGLQIPAGTQAGEYTGTNTFTAVTAPNANW